MPLNRYHSAECLLAECLLAECLLVECLLAECLLAESQVAEQHANLDYRTTNKSQSSNMLSVILLKCCFAECLGIFGRGGG
jgi:hypothetical protein